MNKYGFFIVPSNLLDTCFGAIKIAHIKDNLNYKSTYYDVENSNSNMYSFTYTIPQNTQIASPIYFTLDTYLYGTVPCKYWDEFVIFNVYSKVGSV